MAIYMILDVETTGLPERKNTYQIGEAAYHDYKNTDKYNRSRVVQLSYELYDLNRKKIKSFNSIVKPNNFKIPIQSVKIHGICDEIAQTKGVEIDKIFDEMHNDLQTVNKIVGHNVCFDKHVVLSELYRIKKMETINSMLQKEYVCTGELTKNIIDKKYYKNRLKMGKLGEVYYCLFGKNPSCVHNSEYDVKYCAEIFFKIMDMGIY